LWIACSIGNEHIVRSIFSISKIIKDEPSPDGTTAFSIALAKEYNNITRMFLDLNVGHCSSLYANVKTVKEGKLQKLGWQVDKT
jgi:hypothetical protein